MPHWTDKYAYVFGAPRDSQVGVVALIADQDAEARVELSVPAVWQAGVWHTTKATTIDFSVCGLALVDSPIRQAAMLGLSGHLFFLGSGDEHEEYIRAPNAEPQNIGMMTSLRTIAGNAYAVGMQRQVYRRDGRDRWSDLSSAIRPDPASSVICSFESIDGYAEDELYTCGRDGEIWRYDGTNWHQIESPTNMILTHVLCAPTGDIYIAGRVGMLIKGRQARWEVLERDQITQDIWSLAWFKGRLYAATMNLILELTDEGLKPVPFEGDFPRTSFHLAVALDGSVMWSTGAKDLFSFDGTTWTRLD